jgi:ketosteroid isomerase-like protein
MEHTTNAVLMAADGLIDAFARHDREKYFAAFAEDATFIFHNLDRPLPNRAAYEDEWTLWETRDGFKVVSCQSTDRNLQMLGNVGIFTHAVETTVDFNGEPLTSKERETIVFEKQADGRWLAVHEHLSKAS